MLDGVHARLHCRERALVAVRMCGDPQARPSRFVDERRDLVIGECPLSRVGLGCSGAFRGQELDVVDTSRHQRSHDPADVVGTAHPGPEICELRKVLEEGRRHVRADL